MYFDHGVSKIWSFHPSCHVFLELTPYRRHWHVPGTPNSQFKMDVLWNNHFLCKDLESSNWNNHLYQKIVVWSTRWKKNFNFLRESPPWRSLSGAGPKTLKKRPKPWWSLRCFFDRGDSKWSLSPSISSVINPLIGHIIQLPYGHL